MQDKYGLQTDTNTTTAALPDDIDALLGKFSAEDGATRERARQAVVHLGKLAVPQLVQLLDHPNVQVRWEATKALCDIGDPASAPALVGRLEARDSGVRWMAAQGLIGLGPVALEPVLHALMQRSDSVLLREGAKRVVYGLAGRTRLQPILAPVLDALDAIEPAVVAPLAAHRALEKLRGYEAEGYQGITITRVLVRDWMSANPITIAPVATLADAYGLMQEQHVRRLPVMDDDRLVGIVSLGDLREALPSPVAPRKELIEAERLQVQQLMSSDVITVHPDDTLREAARLMLAHKIGGLPVVEADQLVGIITETDIFRVFAQESPAALGQ